MTPAPDNLTYIPRPGIAFRVAVDLRVIDRGQDELAEVLFEIDDGLDQAQWVADALDAAIFDGKAEAWARARIAERSLR